MANAIIAYGNSAGDGSLSGGSWVSTLPLSNLQDRRLGRVARSANLTTGATQFDLSFPGTRLVRVVALVAHNFSLTAQYRIRLSTDPTFATTVADSGWLPVWPVVYPFGTLPWGAPNLWTGQYSTTEIANYTGIVPYIVSQALNTQYVRVEINDPSNAAGYVQIGRLFIANGWQPIRNIIYGGSLGLEHRTDVQEAISGAEYFNVKRPVRVAKVELDAMTESEAMAVCFEMQRRTGVDGEVFFAWDPSDTTHALRRQFLARLRTLSPIENPGPNRWRTPFEIKELL